MKYTLKPEIKHDIQSLMTGVKIKAQGKSAIETYIRYLDRAEFSSSTEIRFVIGPGSRPLWPVPDF